MLQILFVWIYFISSTYAIGYLNLFWLNKFVFKQNNQVLNKHSSIIYLGISLITVLVICFNFFMPIQWHIHIVLLTAIVGFVLCHYNALIDFLKNIRGQFNNAPFFAKVLFIIFVLVTLFRASGPITNLDSGGYHLPTIKWLEDYKIIKGIGNIHNRYAFNYGCSGIYALFGFKWLFGHTIHAINGVLIILTSTFLLFTNYKWQWLNIAKIICLFFVINMSNASSNLNVDFAVASLCIFVSFNLAAYLFENKKFDALHCTILIIIAFAVILFKLSYLVILFLFIPFLSNLLKHKSLLILVLACGLFFFIPQIFRFYYLSGYLIFPMVTAKVNSPIWQMSAAWVTQQSEGIYKWVFLKSANEPLTFVEMFPRWIQFLKQKNTSDIPLILALLSSVFLHIKFASSSVRAYKQSIAFITIHILFILFWWYIGPDPRFATGYFLPIIAYVFGFLVLQLIKLRNLFFPAMFILLIANCLVLLLGKNLSHVKANAKANTKLYFIKQAPYPTNKVDTTYSRGLPIYNVPDTCQCWEHPQPCGMKIDSFEYIGASIKDGFKIKGN